MDVWLDFPRGCHHGNCLAMDDMTTMDVTMDIIQKEGRCTKICSMVKRYEIVFYTPLRLDMCQIHNNSNFTVAHHIATCVGSVH